MGHQREITAFHISDGIQSVSGNPTYIGADVPLDERRFPIRELLTGFRGLAASRPDVRLALAGHRSQVGAFSVFNFIEEAGLGDRVEFVPYYDRCRRFPVKKSDCSLWIGPDCKAADLTTSALARGLTGAPREKSALFFTSFHPGKLEGNSTCMRQWLRRMRAGGYRTHLVYYGLDRDKVTDAMRADASLEYDAYTEIEVSSQLVGLNRNGLNVHVDDWCGGEALEAVSALCAHTAFDVVVVNYAFMSAVLDAIPAYTEKILFTHDIFADRNRKMLAQGFSSAGWVSLSTEGERLACQRADVVVAIQDEEAAHFRSLCDDATKVITISPVFEGADRPPATPSPNGKLRIGYLGSGNWVNEENLGLYLKGCLAFHNIAQDCEFLVAGGVDEDLLRRLTPRGEAVLAKLQPSFLGRVDDLQGFFDRCDIIVNPDRGGTGIKIKTLEALAGDAALLTTKAGAAGLASASRFHNAADPAALAAITAEVARDRALLTEVREESRRAYNEHRERHRDAFDQVFGLGDTRPRPSPAAGEPLVSVIIPFFNVEAYIGACLESVIAQDYANLEIILVDDASPCGSRAIANEFARRDGRVQLVTHAVNQGLGPARNSGVRAATGAFIFFLDSDDLLARPSVIRKLVETAERRSSEITVGACVKLMPNGEVKPGDTMDAKGSANEFGGALRGVDAFRAGLRLPRSAYLPPRAWGALIERRFYERAMLDFPPNEHEDLAHTPFIYHLANEVFYLRDPIVRYRVREDSISNSSWPPERILRYRTLWNTFKDNVDRFGLEAHLGDAAINLLSHMIWRIEQNNAGPIAWAPVGAVVRDVLSTVRDIGDKDELYKFLRNLRRFLKKNGAPAGAFLDMVRRMPASALVGYYSEELGPTPPTARTAAASRQGLELDPPEPGPATEDETATLRSDLDAALEVFERYFIAQNASQRVRRLVRSLGYQTRWPFYWAMREMAKLLNTIGLRREGEHLWKHAKQRLAEAR